MTHRFTLRQLEYFVAAASAGQISIAAAQCNVSQSAMTVAVRNLEDALGARLFVRIRGGVALTHQGEVFLHRAKTVLDAAGETSRFPFHERTDVEGDLIVPTTYMVLGYFLLRSLANFRKLFPRVNVVPTELTREQIERRLARGQISIAAVILSNLQSPKRVHSLQLIQSRRRAWVSHDHPLVGRESVSLADLTDYPYVIPRVDDGEMNAKIRWQEAAKQPVSWLHASSLEAVREMVAIGLGVTILPDMLFHPWSLDGRRIHAIPVSSSIPDIRVGLVWSWERPLSACESAFREFLALSASR
ncbi:LysR family transcriptional regulator [Polaromonas sp.]|uniref:LysR family transcriptional regulator n=1 Tax=Polaromonas sp. TaxID=1869339 RepID=UPI0017F9ABE4|nr:LysR family transcriptional regulator [Polaromonas sp.]NMM06757.1 LysR family transcriptional regulator [Polaromonas sp.]